MLIDLKRNRYLDHMAYVLLSSVSRRLSLVESSHVANMNISMRIRANTSVSFDYAHGCFLKSLECVSNYASKQVTLKMKSRDVDTSSHFTRIS